MVAGADLWVYNAENLVVSFFNQVASIFHLGEEKKLSLPNTYKFFLSKSRLNDRFYLAIFGDICGREPNLYSKFSDFDCLSVSFDFFV